MEEGGTKRKAESKRKEEREKRARGERANLFDNSLRLRQCPLNFVSVEAFSFAD
jgi:hypothetical protein